MRKIGVSSVSSLFIDGQEQTQLTDVLRRRFCRCAGGISGVSSTGLLPKACVNVALLPGIQSSFPCLG
jgi:hypothetical protein